MRKLIVAAGTILSLSLIATNDSVNAEETPINLSDYLTEDFAYKSRTGELDYVFTLLEDATLVDEEVDLETLISPMEDAETYFTFLGVGLQVNEEADDSVLVEDISHSFAFVHETEDFLEVDMYYADVNGNILSPMGYGNSDNDEMYLYNVEENQWEDASAEHTVDELIYLRYAGIRDSAIELSDYVEVFETDEYYVIGTFGQEEAVINKIDDTVEITFEGTTDESLHYGFLTYVEKESNMIVYHTIFATATDESGDQRISSEFYSFFTDFNKYENLEDLNEQLSEEGDEEEGGNLDDDSLEDTEAGDEDQSEDHSDDTSDEEDDEEDDE